MIAFVKTHMAHLAGTDTHAQLAVATLVGDHQIATQVLAPI